MSELHIFPRRTIPWAQVVAALEASGGVRFMHDDPHAVAMGAALLAQDIERDVMAQIERDHQGRAHKA